MITAKLKFKIAKYFLRKTKCPICGYPISMCQCLYGGSCHPDRNEEREVVLSHLHLLSKTQLRHIINLEKYWSTSYEDEKRSKILKRMEEAGAR